MVENLDRWVGIYVEELKRRGEFENTIIVFSSDHGEMLGDHNRWAKIVPYEPSVCVPLIVGGPNMKSRRSSALVSLIDVGATFLEYAKADRPKGMTARSFRPLIEGKTDVHREYVNSGLFNWRLVSDARYKLIRGFDPKRKQAGGSVQNGAETPLLLYDLEKDPLENRNFSEGAPEVVARLEKLLPSPNPDPNFGKGSYENYGRKA
jgi:arylsulfatase